MMMGNASKSYLIFVLLLAGCSGPPVVSDSRGPFDTVTGLYGGNEFSPLSPEGRREFKGEAPATPVKAPEPIAVAAAGAASPNMSPIAVTGSDSTRIGIDANAYGAVFGATPGPIKPNAAQLMQLDSLSLVAADTLRVDLQKKILECRRAGDGCRLVSQ